MSTGGDCEDKLTLSLIVMMLIAMILVTVMTIVKWSMLLVVAALESAIRYLEECWWTWRLLPALLLFLKKFMVEERRADSTQQQHVIQ